MLVGRFQAIKNIALHDEDIVRRARRLGEQVLSILVPKPHLFGRIPVGSFYRRAAGFWNVNKEHIAIVIQHKTSKVPVEPKIDLILCR